MGPAVACQIRQTIENVIYAASTVVVRMRKETGNSDSRKKCLRLDAATAD